MSKPKGQPGYDAGRQQIFQNIVQEFSDNAYINNDTKMRLHLKVTIVTLFDLFLAGYQ
jgi:hypothetical protein